MKDDKHVIKQLQELEVAIYDLVREGNRIVDNQGTDWKQRDRINRDWYELFDNLLAVFEPTIPDAEPVLPDSEPPPAPTNSDP